MGIKLEYEGTSLPNKRGFTCHLKNGGTITVQAFDTRSAIVECLKSVSKEDIDWLNDPAIDNRIAGSMLQSYLKTL